MVISSQVAAAWESWSYISHPDSVFSDVMLATQKRRHSRKTEVGKVGRSWGMFKILKSLQQRIIYLKADWPLWKRTLNEHKDTNVVFLNYNTFPENLQIALIEAICKKKRQIIPWHAKHFELWWVSSMKIKICKSKFVTPLAIPLYSLYVFYT